MERAVSIAACGVRCSVGVDAGMAASSARAGLNRFEALDDLVDRDGEPVVVALPIAPMGSLDDDDRLAALAVPALRECLDALSTRVAGPRRAAVYVTVPPAREGFGDAARRLADTAGRVVETAGLPAQAIDALVRVPGEHAAGLAALVEANARIAAGELDLALVLGCDSYLTRPCLARLDEDNRLKTERTRWGMIPGEAAAVVALAAGEVLTASARGLARVSGAAVAREENHRGSGRVCVGVGLTRALRGALQGRDGEASLTLCDLNGDRQRADELGFALTRLGGGRVASAGISTPADCWGDVGAATGPLLVAAAALWRDEGPRAGFEARIALASSDDGRCAALALEAPMTRRL